MSDPRYPIGKFHFDGPPDPEQRTKLIDDIAQTPAALRAAVNGFTPQQIETPYRDGGWTVRQVVHHVPESHMNAYIRFKLALTEDVPTIKPYMEDRWAKLPDVQSTPLEVSLTLLDSLHDRWVHLLRSIKPQNGSGLSTIPRWDWCRWRKTLRCIRGTAGITSRISRNCGRGWVGNCHPNMQRTHDEASAPSHV